MTTENISRPEREDNQQPPVTPTRCVLNHIFAAALTSFTAICNQFQPQEVVIRDFEAELDINNSSSDITITPSDREPHLGLSSGENHNEERIIGINEINRIHQQEKKKKQKKTISIALTPTKTFQKNRRTQTKRIQTRRKKKVKRMKEVTHQRFYSKKRKLAK